MHLEFEVGYAGTQVHADRANDPDRIEIRKGLKVVRNQQDNNRKPHGNGQRGLGNTESIELRKSTRHITLA